MPPSFVLLDLCIDYRTREFVLFEEESLEYYFLSFQTKIYVVFSHTFAEGQR
jgi:hypothetical protein